MARIRPIVLLLTLLMLGQGVSVSKGEVDSPPSYVNFSFDQVDIRLLVKLVGEMTGRRFVVDESMSGQVTVVTPSQIPLDEVYPLFISILESTGFSVVEKGETHHIVRLPERTLPTGPVVGPSEQVTTKGVVTKVIRVNHVSALELRKVVEPMVAGGKTGALVAFGPTNHIILTDTEENVRRIEKIVAELDKAGQARTMEVVKLKHASADDVARQLTTALRGGSTAGERLSQHVRQVSEGGAGLPTGITLVPTPHSNSLVLVGTPVQLADIKRVLAEMDVEGEAGRGRLNAIFLKYLSAEDAAKNLTALLGSNDEKGERGRISIEASIANNALLVDASPRDFEVVRQLVMELDEIPQQVLVEVIVAEISSGEDLDLGVELATVQIPQENRTTAVGGTEFSGQSILSGLASNVLPEGLTFALAKGAFVDPTGAIIPRVPFILQALAEDREVSIRANVPLWAENNTEASVSVVDDIPILTSTVEGSAAGRDIVQTIERLDVGLTLTLTPHINPEGDIRLQLNPRIEAVVEESQGDLLLTPTIAKREVSTTVTIPDRSTVVISGLIREDSVTQVSKVPFLGDIPLLGFLFKRTTDRKQRTDLLIFVTPYIVTDTDQAEAMRHELEARTSLALPGVTLGPAEVAEE